MIIKSGRYIYIARQGESDYYSSRMHNSGTVFFVSWGGVVHAVSMAKSNERSAGGGRQAYRGLFPPTAAPASRAYCILARWGRLASRAYCILISWGRFKVYRLRRGKCKQARIQTLLKLFQNAWRHTAERNVNNPSRWQRFVSQIPVYFQKLCQCEWQPIIWNF